MAIEPKPASDATVMLVENLRRNSAPAAASSGGGPTDGSMEYRVSALEKSVEKMDAKLDKIIESMSGSRIESEKRFGSISERLTAIDAKIDTKSSAMDLAEIKGRVTSLPTTWQMVTVVIGTVFTIPGGAFLILKFGLPHTP